MYFGCAETDSYAPTEMVIPQSHLKEIAINARVEWYPGTQHGFVFPKERVCMTDSAERHWERLFPCTAAVSDRCYMRCRAQILLPAEFWDRQYTSSSPPLPEYREDLAVVPPARRRPYARRPPLPDFCGKAESKAVAVRSRFTVNGIGNTKHTGRGTVKIASLRS